MSERSNKLAESIIARMRARLAEEVEELDEISKSTLGSYIKKATNQVFSKGVAGGMGLASSNKEDEASGHRQVNKAAKRMLGVNKAASKLSGHGYTKVPANEEAEELDELSKETLRKYEKTTQYGGTHKNVKGNQIARAKLHGSADGYRARVPANEEVEELDELSKGTLARYAIRAKNQLARSEFGAGREVGMRNMDGKGQGEMEKAYNRRADKRHQGLDMAIDKLAKEEADMLDTALSDVKQSSKGEVYSKTSEKCSAPTKPTGTKTGVTAGKTGEAYNTTGITKRIPAVENAVLDVMAKSLERRRIYNESANIAIITPEQRNDWMNVERGTMDVVDYFNKYRAGEE